jgi:hypothetical protein
VFAECIPKVRVDCLIVRFFLVTCHNDTILEIILGVFNYLHGKVDGVANFVSLHKTGLVATLLSWLVSTFVNILYSEFSTVIGR